MTFDHHPRALIEVYVDGRVALLFTEGPKSMKDALAIRCIRILVGNHWERLGTELAPDRYEFKLNEFKFLSRMGFFELSLLE